MHVAITGGSSLTGSRIASFFHEKGYEVSALFTRVSLAEYSPLQKKRIEPLSCGLHFGIRAEDSSCAEWIRGHCPDLWIHHHHYMDNFRSKSYDYHEFNMICIEPLERILDALSASGCKRVIHSGTYFEEPRHEKIQEFFPYVVGKLQVWAQLLQLCTEREINLGKIVIPNVVDPLENRDRALPTFFSHVLEGREFQVLAPANVIDSLPAEGLARAYFNMARQLLQEKVAIARPSGWKGNMGDWLQFANTEIGKRINRSLIRIDGPLRQTEVTSYFNTEDTDINWNNFWDQYVAEFDCNLQ